jgi:hypothetical protein
LSDAGLAKDGRDSLVDASNGASQSLFVGRIFQHRFAIARGLEQIPANLFAEPELISNLRQMVLMQAERLFKGHKNSFRLLGVGAVQPERRDDFLLSRDATQGACYVRFGLHEMMQLALPIHADLLTGGSAIGLSATGA